MLVLYNKVNRQSLSISLCCASGTCCVVTARNVVSHVETHMVSLLMIARVVLTVFPFQLGFHQ